MGRPIFLAREWECGKENAVVLFIIILTCVCFYNTKVIKKDRNVENILSLDCVEALKGILAIEIVLGHTYGARKGTELLGLNDRIGVCVVAVFFFLSGYGLYLSVHQKSDYLTGFVFRKIGRIFFPFIIVFFIRCIMFRRFKNVFSDFISELLFDWFIVEILIVYFMWWLLYKFASEIEVLVYLGIGVLLLNIVGCYLEIGTRWYGSTACFLAGSLVAMYENIIRKYCEVQWRRLALCIGLAFVSFIGIFMVASSQRWIACLSINGTCICACSLLYLVLMKVRIGNRITSWWGSVSWEIYIVHRTVIACLKNFPINNIFVWMILLISLISMGAWCVYVVCRFSRTNISKMMEYWRFLHGDKGKRV